MAALFEDLALMPGYSATPAASDYRKRRIGIDIFIVQRKISTVRYGKLVYRVQVPVFADCRGGALRHPDRSAPRLGLSGSPTS